MKYFVRYPRTWVWLHQQPFTCTRGSWAIHFQDECELLWYICDSRHKPLTRAVGRHSLSSP